MWGKKKAKPRIYNDLAFKKVPTTGFLQEPVLGRAVDKSIYFSVKNQLLFLFNLH
jgi:hypothetical protein